MFANKCFRNALAVGFAVAIFLMIVSRLNTQSVLGIIVISTVVYFICYVTSREKNRTVFDKE
ncbi:MULTISPECIES: hypothetical protein [Shouchella]|uniref:Uncharacterized protein n=2 Tax=Shouchella TaxID=2893057 RepID=A0ABY7W2A7_9BACI|nr:MULTISPECIES: hypothetical protein [Shouchella]MED4130679.1 hypothetical protein [Shouchella miscanthi]WDF02706.1 hypothetical protein PQ477_14420 [Shouchella hunanensis]